jgi:diphosphate-dependent phosphofructokinase
LYLLDQSIADEIAKLFPNMLGQPSVSLVSSTKPTVTRPLKVGVVLSGGQTPGGHNVIYDIFSEYVFAC